MLKSQFKKLLTSKKLYNSDQGLKKKKMAVVDLKEKDPWGILTDLGPFIPGNKS